MNISQTDIVRNLLETICRSIIVEEHPLLITIHQPTPTILISEIKVHKSMIGLLIGRGGRIIEAIRILVRSSCKQQIVHSVVEVTELEDEND